MDSTDQHTVYVMNEISILSGLNNTSALKSDGLLLVNQLYEAYIPKLNEQFLLQCQTLDMGVAAVFRQTKRDFGKTDCESRWVKLLVASRKAARVPPKV